MADPSATHSSGTGWLLALLPALAFGWFAAQIPAIRAGETLSASLPWVPSLGIALSFQLDGLSLLFALLIAGIGALIVVYAGAYLAGHPQRGRLFVLLGAFTLAMLGLVCAGDLLTLFVFWEATSVTSYLLIGFDHERPAARDAALQALLLTGAGGLALLAGALLLGGIAGGYEFQRLTEAAPILRAHPLYLPALLCILFGAFTKSAQVPFHFWLPGAMEAPTPVSAYLHSATMVQAGVFLVARLHPALGGTDAWHDLLLLAGTATMLTGAVLALVQRDLKRLLAYSTVSALGTLILLIGIGTSLAIEAAMVFVLVHALYKAALFLVAGALDHETGTRDLARLGGLRRAMPVLAAAALLAGLSMSGLPPMLGFLSKELLYEAKLKAPDTGLWITLAGVLANILTVAVAGAVGLRPFWGRTRTPPRAGHEPPLALLLGPLLLAALGLVIGLRPTALAEPLIEAAVTAVRAEPTTVTLTLWHGINPVLALSAFTVAAGALVFALAGRERAARLAARLTPLGAGTPSSAYAAALVALRAVAAGQTRVLQNGTLGIYLIVVLGTLLAAASLALPGDIGWRGSWTVTPVGAPAIVTVGLLVAGALLAITSPSRLAAIAALGLVGYAIALLFVLFGAPDLALTQFAIETLTVILFVLVIYRLPPFAILSTRAQRIRDAAVAVAVGGLMGTLVLLATASPLRARLHEFFAAQSAVAAHGRNVVNVILVDFRALDTLGEITVLAVAAIGIWALSALRLERGPGDRVATAETPPSGSMLFRGAARRLMPLLLLFSLFLLLRGHNLPGGGFVGGLIAAAAYALYLLAFGAGAARRLLGLAPQRLIGLGLLVAGGSGLVGAARGLPFLTGVWSAVPVPLLGAVGTPLVFDAGVYLVVLGVVLLMLFSLSDAEGGDEQAA